MHKTPDIEAFRITVYDEYRRNVEDRQILQMWREKKKLELSKRLKREGETLELGRWRGDERIHLSFNCLVMQWRAWASYFYFLSPTLHGTWLYFMLASFLLFLVKFSKERCDGDIIINMKFIIHVKRIIMNINYFNFI